MFVNLKVPVGFYCDISYMPVNLLNTVLLENKSKPLLTSVLNLYDNTDDVFLSRSRLLWKQAIQVSFFVIALERM